MKQIHYIDKTFPITLQDLNDLAKSQNLDPKDLKLITNSNSYVQCALLNQDCDKISIELYTQADKINTYNETKLTSNETK